MTYQQIPAQGAAAKASALPVTMATDQPSIGVSATNTVTVSASNVLTVSANNSLTVLSHNVTAVGAFVSDAPYTKGTDRGFMLLGNRNDSGTTQQASANANYAALSLNASGHAWVTSAGLPVSATNVVTVSANNTVTVSASNTVTVSASNTVTVSANNALSSMGVSASDAVGTSINPVSIGMVATAVGANPTAVSNAGDLSRWYTQMCGVPFVIGGHPNVTRMEWEVSAANTNVVVLSSAAGQKYVVTEVEFLLAGNATANVSVRAGFASANLPATSTAVGGATGVLIVASALPPGAGVVVGNGAGIIGTSLDSQGVTITNTAVAGGRGKLMLSYYTLPS